MPRGRHRHSPPLHRLLPPSAIAGVSVVCALAPWVFTEPMVLRGLAAAAAATAVVGAVVMRRWDAQAGKQVADLTRARASDEWRHEERVAELETDLEESRELRVKLEQRLRAKRAELAGLRNEHAALLRRYATAEADRATVLEERRVLEIEAATPARALPPVPVAAAADAEAVAASVEAEGTKADDARSEGAQAGRANPEAARAEDAQEEPAESATAVFSPEGSRLFLRAQAALARFDGEEEAGESERDASTEALGAGGSAEAGEGPAEDAETLKGDSGKNVSAGGDAAGNVSSEYASSEDVSREDSSREVGSPEYGSRENDSAANATSPNVPAQSESAQSEPPADEPPTNLSPKGDGPSKGEPAMDGAEGYSATGVTAGRSTVGASEVVESSTGVAGGSVAAEAGVMEAGATGGAGSEPALEDEARGKPEAVDGHERATATTTAGALAKTEPALPASQPRTGHFIAPTAVAVVPATPARRPSVEGGFDFFGTKTGPEASAIESVQNEDLADVVGQEALALHKAESEAEFKPADEESRGIGQVIDLTAHDETEQIDVQGLRSAVS